jgi:hypothetical protein
MWDAAGDPAAGVGGRVRPVGQGLAASLTAAGDDVVLSPDWGFLSDPATAYPVTVDPLYGLTLYADTFVWSGSASSNYNGSQWCRAGSPDGSTAQRALLRFQVPASLTGTHIQDATLRVYQEQAGSCAATTANERKCERDGQLPGRPARTRSPGLLGPRRVRSSAENGVHGGPSLVLRVRP